MAPRPPADWLPVAEARDRILASVPRLPPERRSLHSALGHVLAEDVGSPLDLPPWDNSAMDGFAVRAEDVRGARADAPVELPVSDDVPAGSTPGGPLAPGTAARVTTGAPVPAGADGVIRVEHTDGGRGVGSPGGRVRIDSDADAGRNIRMRGEDVRRGALVLRAGTVLRAAEIGLAASLGRSQLLVVRRPVVGIVTSGDELVEVDGFAAVLEGRRIVSSNGPALAAQLAESGMEGRLLGIAADTPASLREHLERARGCDVLLTSAGISVGEHDHVRAVLEEMAVEVDFWRVRMRPGSPLAFGRVAGLGGIPWFGLPGNPVSSMVTFELFVRPALLRMGGHRAVHLPVRDARLAGGAAPAPGLTQFLRVRLERDAEGTWLATPTGPQGSGILSSMAAADALLVVPGDAPGGGSPGPRPAIVLGGRPLRETPGY
jgi:molybdopterin molybdotransferase